MFIHFIVFLESVRKYQTGINLREEKLAYNVRVPFHHGRKDMTPGREGMTTGAEGPLSMFHIYAGSKHKQEVGLAYKALRLGIVAGFLLKALSTS